MEGLMEFLNVLVVVVVGFVFGVIWYMVLLKLWVEVVNIEVDENGWLINDILFLYIMVLVVMIFVVGMMCYVFGMGVIIIVSKGLIFGLGIGLFFILLWIMINNVYGGWLFKLILIDSGYVVFGCGVIGVVLIFF